MSEGPTTDTEMAFFDSIVASAMSGAAIDALASKFMVETEHGTGFEHDPRAYLVRVHEYAVQAAQIALEARRKR